MEQATIDEEPTDAQISKTVRHIHGWITQRVDTETKCTVPSYAAVEKKAVQPILACLLRTLSLIGTEEKTADEKARNQQHVAVAPAAVAASGHPEGAKYALEPAVRSDVHGLQSLSAGS